MDIKLDKNRWRTTSAYDPRILKTLNRLEGQKRWGANRSFSFEDTPFNLEVWRSVFPEAAIENGMCLESPEMVQGWLEASRGTRPTFQFKTPPRDHQRRALEKLSKLKCSGLFMDIGTGKSWTGIALIGMRWCSGESDHVLLIAPNGVHEQWIMEQLPKHMSEVVPWRATIFGQKKRHKEEFNKLIAFDGLKIFSIHIDAISTKAGELAILEFLRSANGRGTIILDESQLIKNYKSQRTKAALKFRGLCKYAIIMTGTPIARDVIDLFSQFQFLDPAILGFKYITTFKGRYCEYIDSDHGPKLIGHKNLDELYNKIEPHIFRITSDEALNLPPPEPIERPFKLHEEQRNLMKQLRDQFFVDFGNDEKLFIKNAVSLITRLQQISCGYLPLEDGSIRRLPNPRLDSLKDILEQRSGKIIIWCRFHFDIELLEEEFMSRSATYYGKNSSEQRKRNKTQFIEDPECLYFLASPEAGGTGLDGLQHVCKTNVYYSNSFNALARWQSEGRTRRDGTTETVTYFDLIAQNSPDRKILNNLREKKSVSDLTLDEYRQMLNFDEDDIWKKV